MTGPMIMAVVVIAVQIPIARPCAAPRNVAVMSARELGTRNAPAAPWSARATMRNSAVGANAMATLVTPNPMTPMRITSARPYASLTDPATRMSAPRVIR
jgi:hypothetical protein